MIDQEYETLKQTSREDLIAFSVFVNPQYTPQPFHYQIAEKLEAVARGEIKNLIISLPPQHGKSLLSSINFPAWILGRFPNKRFMAASYAADLIQTFSKRSRNVVLSEPYKQLFNVELASEGAWHWDTTQKGYYHAVGVGGASTWFGYDIGLIDDPFKDREEAESPTIRQKVWDWWTSTFYTRKGKDAATIIIMTRWHVDDLVGRLLKQEQLGWQKWEQLIIPAIDETWKGIWESKFDYPQIRADIGVRDFAALYMQDPILSTGAIFKPSDFKYFNYSEFEMEWRWKKEHILLWIFIDPAFSTQSSSDDAVIMVVWLNQYTSDMYLFDIYCATSAPSATIWAMFNMIDKREIRWFKIEFISVEQVKINKDQTKFRKDITDEMSNRNKFYKLYDFCPRVKKQDRIKFWLEPRFNLWKVWFIQGEGDYTALKKMEDQLTMFPKNTHDDIIDCLAQSVQVFAERWKTTSSNQHTQKPRTYFNTITGQMETIK